jgi:hypothetical protein
VAEDLFDTPTGALRQGDIFEPLHFLRAEASDNDGSLQPTFAKRSEFALLLNQSCDIDKPTFTRLIIVPVLRLDGLKSADQTSVRKNKIYARLHLPPYRDLLPESFVSFIEPMTVGRVFLEQRKRLVSLSEKGRRALYLQYVRWLTRWALAEIACPGCNIMFNPGETLPIVND